MSKAARLAALQRMKQSKEQGGKLADNIEIEEEQEIFRELNDKEYNDLQTTRATDSFIDGDNGLGYAETGMDDDWGESLADETSKEKAKKKAKKNAEKAAAQQEKESKALKKAQRQKRMGKGGNLFGKPKASTKGTLLAFTQAKLTTGLAKPVQTSESTNALADSLLGNIFGDESMEVDEDPSVPPVAPVQATTLPSTAAAGQDTAPSPPRKKAKTAETSKTVSANAEAEEIVQGMETDSFATLAPRIGSMEMKSPAITSKSQTRPPPTAPLDSRGPRPTRGNSALMGGTKLEIKSASPEFDESSVPANEEGKLNMYLLDAYEDHRRPGTVYLFGKVPVGQTFQSCCLVVKNIDRTVYFLPRVKPLDSNGNEISDSDLIDESKGRVKMMAVYQEVNQLREQYRVPKFKSKFLKRKFCFRVRKDYGVPAEADVLMVKYPFDKPMLDRNDAKHANTYSHIFGTRDTALELLILQRGLKGPGWISFPDTTNKSNASCSWAKKCLQIDEPHKIEWIQQQKPAPPVRVMSIGMQTVMDAKKNHEVLVLSWSIHDRVNVEGATTNTQPKDRQCMCRKLKGMDFPKDLQSEIAKRGITIPVKMCHSEKEMLNLFLNKVQLSDPDFIVGHNLYKFGLDVLLTRMKANKIKNWSKMGRLRRTRFPFKSSGGLREDVAPGRLMVDTWSSAQEFVREKTYSLSYLSEKYLGAPERKPYNMNLVPQMWTANADSVLKIIEKSLIDANNTLQLMFKLEILPQTKQMTSLCGNVWAASLRSQRARRNEYMLMHEFHREDYIYPEKYTKREKIALGIIADKSKGKRKPDYEGGLVLEPKKGFYDKYIILLDFNSLYPSCIQEYNLCFTTCEWWKKGKDGKVEAEMPDPSLAQGILPKVITYLLNTRKAVKNEMKREQDPEKKKMLDIRQKALKLVANSMYGCLGFSTSRFYAKSIAALITAMGRANLQRAKECAEDKHNMNVVYGDTDSIMVYTDESDYHAACKVGFAIRKSANRGYKYMYLEVDDVFKKMLLLRKKKYAALKEEKDPTSPTGTKLIQEKKGLDLVRRDWSIWSKEVGSNVLDIILGDANAEDTVDQILEYLRDQRLLLDKGHIALEKFVITKKLTKAPSHYSDAAKQPHVQVAMRMIKRGQHVGSGGFIPYVICKGEAKDSVAQKAYHLDELRSSQEAGETKLEIDNDWYLQKQIMPPTGRLCNPIQGLDMGQIAQSLGLDTSKYAAKRVVGLDDDDDEDFALSEDACKSPDMFIDVNPFKIRCPSCSVAKPDHPALPYEGLFKWSSDGGTNFLCHNQRCKGLIRPAPGGEAEAVVFSNEINDFTRRKVHYNVDDVNKIKNQLTRATRTEVKGYYRREMQCSDSTCSMTTRQMCVRGEPCPQAGCQGQMVFTTTEKKLYEQLRYFAALFQLKPSKKRLTELQTQDPGRYATATGMMAPHEQEAAEEIHRHAEQLCRQSGYHYVDTGSLFSRCGFKMVG